MTWDEFGKYLTMTVGVLVIAQYLIDTFLKSLAKFIRDIRCDRNDKERDDD